MNTYSLTNSGDKELNDVCIDQVFLVSSRAYTFTFHPKSDYWRIGLRFTSDSRGVHSPVSGRYNDSNVAHLEICAGTIDHGQWVGPNVLQLQHYNFIQVPNTLHGTDQYTPHSPVELTICPIDGTSMEVQYKHSSFGTFTQKVNHSFKRHFQVYAWADHLDFKVEAQLETTLVPLTIEISKQKAIANEVFLGVRSLCILYGRNNAGKTSILLGACDAYRSGHDHSVDYLGIARHFSSYDYASASDLEDSGESTKIQRANRQKRCENRRLPDEPFDDWARELALLQQEDRDRAIEFFNEHFEQWTFTRTNQSKYKVKVDATVNGHPVIEQGTGALAALPIIIQLFNPEVQLLTIDEPEFGLEPMMEKRLFKAIKDASEGRNGFPKKRIILATHSHLFIDRDNITNNYRVEKRDGEVTVRQLTEPTDLQEAVYTLMGSDPTDLFFPSNIVVVEGKTEVIFLKAIHKKMFATGRVTKNNLVFYPLGSFDKARFGLETIVQMLRTVTELPMYKDRICGLFDLSDPKKTQITDYITKFFKGDPGGRYVYLSRNGIEYYYPLSLAREIANRPITAGEFYREVDSFLKSFSKGNDYTGTFFGQQFTKGDLAEMAARRVEQLSNLDEIDPEICKLIERADELGF